MNQPNVSGALPTAVVDELVGGGFSQAVPTVQAKAQASTRRSNQLPRAAAPSLRQPHRLRRRPQVALTLVATLNKKPKNH